MQVPLELTLKDIQNRDAVASLVREKTQWLHRVCDYLTSCRVAIERPQTHQSTGSPYRVRIDIRVPPGHDVVVCREPGEGNMHDSLETVVRDAFQAARRRLRRLKEKQMGESKAHPDQEVSAVVEDVVRDEDHGFIRTLDGRRIYFHRNAVTNDDFGRLTPGTGVHFVERSGDKGPQASTVRIIDKHR